MGSGSVGGGTISGGHDEGIICSPHHPMDHHKHHHGHHRGRRLLRSLSESSLAVKRQPGYHPSGNTVNFFHILESRLKSYNSWLF